MAIQGFANRAVGRFIADGTVAGGAAGWTRVARIAYRKLDINDLWRVVLRWTEDGPTGVDIRDHH